jgi:hypothetical protein
MYFLRGQNKVVLLWVPGHCGIQVKEYTHAYDREGLSTSPWSQTNFNLIICCWAQG